MAFNNNNNNFMMNNPNININNMNWNQAMLNAYQNILRMNPGLNMNNPMALNNMLNNYMAMNPGLFMMNNQNQNMNNFQAFQPFGNNANTMGTGVKGGNLPRPNTRQFPNIEFYPNYKGPRYNVIFETSTGLKINLNAPPFETVNGLLLNFCQKAGVSPNLLKKELIFVYNANYINTSSKDTIQNFFKQNMGLNDQAKIIVIDAQNIIGA